MRTQNTDTIQLLHVEDSPADARLAAFAIEQAGFAANLVSVRDGEQALSYLFREGEFVDAPRPDLVLLDLNMPRMDGKACLRKIKETEAIREIPVIILSTSDSEDDIADSYRLHANSYMVKPSEFGEFVEAMAALREFWVSAASLPNRIP